MPEYTRKPNCECCQCGTQIYRTPSAQNKGNVFCSKDCYGIFKSKFVKCVVCGITYVGSQKHSKTCSRTCSNKNRAGMYYNKSTKIFPNVSQQRLAVLKKIFNFDCCMVEGCTYSKTYDIHRFIPGKLGGEYVIGNMFAICPNHHAEVTRNLTSFIKVSDSCLREDV